jgi:hypothetical protein
MSENRTEFEEIAQRLAKTLSERLGTREPGISAQEIPDMMGNLMAGEPINCYPGTLGRGCFPKAVFVSLSKPHAKGKNHLSFRQALERLVQHMQGHCLGKTKTAVILTDNWDTMALEDWRFNLDRVQSEASVHIFMIAGGKVTKMQI